VDLRGEDKDKERGGERQEGWGQLMGDRRRRGGKEGRKRRE